MKTTTKLFYFEVTAGDYDRWYVSAQARTEEGAAKRLHRAICPELPIVYQSEFCLRPCTKEEHRKNKHFDTGIGLEGGEDNLIF
jgi:hypothetical protein